MNIRVKFPGVNAALGTSSIYRVIVMSASTQSLSVPFASALGIGSSYRVTKKVAHEVILPVTRYSARIVCRQ